jgi:hypothetical protein
MSKLLSGVAALGVLSLVAISPAAAEQRSDGARNAGNTIEQTEFSDQRRRYRSGRYYGRRYYGPRRYYGGYYRPYYGYAYARPYYRPYYAPAPFPFFPFFW